MGLTVLQGVHIGQPKLLIGNAQGAQGEILGNGVVFAIAGIGGEKLNGSGPVVFLAPVLVVQLVAHAVKEAVDLLQLLFPGLVL